MSKLLPLNVTSIDASRMRAATRSSIGRLLAEAAHEELLDDEAASPLAAPKNASPTRNATVPVPPREPGRLGVEVERAATDRRRRARGSSARSASSSALASRAASDGRAAHAVRGREAMRATWSGPSGVSLREKRELAVSTGGALLGDGGRAEDSRSRGPSEHRFRAGARRSSRTAFWARREMRARGSRTRQSSRRAAWCGRTRLTTIHPSSAVSLGSTRVALRRP